MKKIKLSRAVSLVIAGGVLSLGGMSNASAISTTMYNLSTTIGNDNSTNDTDWTTTLGGGTDGWANGAGIGNQPVGTVANQKWAGTGGVTTTPFGYAGAHLNWAVNFTGGVSNTAEISTFDSFDRYQVYADVDVAKGAWSDADVAGGGASGWLHDTDTGLFRSDVSGTVTLSVEGILYSGTNFGFTIFKGMDAVSTYGHHNGWNAGNNESGLSLNSLPYKYFDGSIMPGANLTVDDIVVYSVGGANPSNLNEISFYAEAGQIYTIFLGGYRNGSWQTTNDGYRLAVSQAVPIPAGAWLFGGALVTLLGRFRRKVGFGYK